MFTNRRFGFPRRQNKKKAPKKKKPNKLISAALNDKVMEKEFFLAPAVEEADEIARILAAKNHFEVLALDPTDDLDEDEDKLREGYLKKVLTINSHISNHPRVAEAFEHLARAYDVLSDPILRQEHKYDCFGGRPEETPFQELGLLGGLFGAMLNDADFMGGANGAPNIFLDARPRQDRNRGNQMVVRQMRPPRELRAVPPNLLFGAPARGPAPRRMRAGEEDPFLAIMNAMTNDLRQTRRRASDDSDSSGEADNGLGGLIELIAEAELEEAERERAERERRIRARRERERARAARRREERAANSLSLLDMLFSGPPTERRVRRPERNDNPFADLNGFLAGLGEGVQERPQVVAATPAVGEVTDAVRATPVRPTSGAPRQATAAPQPSYEEKLASLLNMGFEEADAIRALEFANGNVEHAIAILLG